MYHLEKFYLQNLMEVFGQKENIIFIKQELKDFLRLITHHVNGWYLFLVSILLLASTFLESFSIGMIIPLLSTVIENKNETSNLFNQISNLLLNFFNKNPTLNNMLIIYFSIIISQLLFTLVSSFAQSVVINNFSYELKNSLYRSIIYTKWDYILDKKACMNTQIKF